MGMFGNLLGTIMGGASKPSVPAWNPITLGGAQSNATTANTAALPGLEALASSTSSFNQSQITAMLDKVIPGFTKTASDAQSSIADLVSGKIPTDVSQAVQSSSAARSLTGGFGGSGLAGNLTARDLGLTSLNLMQTGITAEESWTKMMDQLYSPGMFNLQSMFITPQQEFTAEMQNQEQQWNRDWLKKQINAMPDPQKQAYGQAIGGVLDIATSYFTGGLSSMGGGGSSAPSAGQNLRMQNDFSGAGGGGVGGSFYGGNLPPTDSAIDYWGRTGGNMWDQYA